MRKSDIEHPVDYNKDNIKRTISVIIRASANEE